MPAALAEQDTVGSRSSWRQAARRETFLGTDLRGTCGADSAVLQAKFRVRIAVPRKTSCRSRHYCLYDHRFTGPYEKAIDRLKEARDMSLWPERWSCRTPIIVLEPTHVFSVATT